MTSRTVKAAVTTLGAAAASVALATPASAYPTIGNTVQDSGAQGVVMGSVYCTVNSSDPVVVSINNVRYVRTVASLSCNAPVHARDVGAALYTGGAVVTKRIAAGPYYNRTSLSVIADRACNGVGNRYWAGIAEFRLDMNRDGYLDALVQDASLSTLRSCGL
jgi:hypothetical protein